MEEMTKEWVRRGGEDRKGRGKEEGGKERGRKGETEERK